MGDPIGRPLIYDRFLRYDFWSLGKLLGSGYTFLISRGKQLILLNDRVIQHSLRNGRTSSSLKRGSSTKRWPVSTRSSPVIPTILAPASTLSANVSVTPG